MNLGSNLKKIRKDNNLSQEELADKLGVSRQAVSKWESGLAIPEMEKLISICKLFDYNIDDLLNQDIEEVNENKQTKGNINKYVDDFLNFITKVVNMFSSMNWQTKIKCILEQLIIGGVIALVLFFIGAVVLSIVSSILIVFPDRVYYLLYNIISDIYSVFCLILGVILLVHIFKVRYLDYYVIFCDNNNGDEEKGEPKFLNNQEKKVIIRDPDKSGDRFIALLFREIIFLVKVFALFFCFGFCCSLVFFSFLFILSFLFIKTGLVFVGSLLMIVGAIVINLIILIILYNFIVDKKIKKNILFLLFVSSLVVGGIGCGIFCIGFTDFKVDNYNSDNSNEVVISWSDDLRICDDYYNITYVESDDKDVRIKYEYSKYYDVEVINHDNNIWFDVYFDYDDNMQIIRDYIEDINDKRFVDYSNISVTVYTNLENIEKIKNNSKY